MFWAAALPTLALLWLTKYYVSNRWFLSWMNRKKILSWNPTKTWQKDNQTLYLPSFKEMVCPGEPWPVFTLGEFPWQNFDPLAVTPISAFYLVSEISSTCLPSLATSSNFWPSKSSRQTRWGLCGAYLRLMLILMVMLLLMFFLKLINRWGRCGICGKSTNRGGCSGWGRTWPKNIYLNIANGTSVPGIDCFNQSANLCLLFSNTWKGRLHYIYTVG